MFSYLLFFFRLFKIFANIDQTALHTVWSVTYLNEIAAKPGGKLRHGCRWAFFCRNTETPALSVHFLLMIACHAMAAAHILQGRHNAAAFLCGIFASGMKRAPLRCTQRAGHFTLQHNTRALFLCVIIRGGNRRQQRHCVRMKRIAE